MERCDGLDVAAKFVVETMMQASSLDPVAQNGIVQHVKSYIEEQIIAKPQLHERLDVDSIFSNPTLFLQISAESILSDPRMMILTTFPPLPLKELWPTSSTPNSCLVSSDAQCSHMFCSSVQFRTLVYQRLIMSFIQNQLPLQDAEIFFRRMMHTTSFRLVIGNIWNEYKQQMQLNGFHHFANIHTTIHNLVSKYFHHVSTSPTSVVQLYDSASVPLPVLETSQTISPPKPVLNSVVKTPQFFSTTTTYTPIRVRARIGSYPFYISQIYLLINTVKFLVWKNNPDFSKVDVSEVMFQSTASNICMKMAGYVWHKLKEELNGKQSGSVNLYELNVRAVQIIYFVFFEKSFEEHVRRSSVSKSTVDMSIDSEQELEAPSQDVDSQTNPLVTSFISITYPKMIGSVAEELTKYCQCCIEDHANHELIHISFEQMLTIISKELSKFTTEQTQKMFLQKDESTKRRKSQISANALSTFDTLKQIYDIK